MIGKDYKLMKFSESVYVIEHDYRTLIVSDKSLKNEDHIGTVHCQCSGYIGRINKNSYYADLVNRVISENKESTVENKKNAVDCLEEKYPEHYKVSQIHHKVKLIQNFIKYLKKEAGAQIIEDEDESEISDKDIEHYIYTFMGINPVTLRNEERMISDGIIDAFKAKYETVLK